MRAVKIVDVRAAQPLRNTSRSRATGSNHSKCSNDDDHTTKREVVRPIARRLTSHEMDDALANPSKTKKQAQDGGDFHDSTGPFYRTCTTMKADSAEIGHPSSIKTRATASSPYGKRESIAAMNSAMGLTTSCQASEWSAPSGQSPRRCLPTFHAAGLPST